MSLLPPQEGKEYVSRESVMEALQCHAQFNRYAISTRRWNAKDQALYLKCDREGEYKARHGLTATNRARDTRTRLIDCLFSVRANCKQRVWTFKVRNANHNYDGTSSSFSYPIQCRMPPDVKAHVEALSTSGSKPREIRLAISQTTNHTLIAQDVYNARSTLRLKNLAGKSPIEALIATLEHGMYKFNYQTDSIGRVTHLFFAHPKCIALFQQYSDVLLMDCIYRTNNFKMPLLNIVGTTCLNKNYHVVFCFLAKEKERDYTWALSELKKLLRPDMNVGVVITDREMALINACKEVFPGTTCLLCTWHIEKNVLTYAAEAFKKGNARDTFMKAWVKVIQSTTIQLYENNWNTLQDTYDMIALGIVQYIKDTWLVKWKRFIVHAYTDKSLYLSNRITS